MLITIVSVVAILVRIIIGKESVGDRFMGILFLVKEKMCPHFLAVRLASCGRCPSLPFGHTRRWWRVSIRPLPSYPQVCGGYPAANRQDRFPITNVGNDQRGKIPTRNLWE
jgi:hypothetical protein